MQKKTNEKLNVDPNWNGPSEYMENFLRKKMLEYPEGLLNKFDENHIIIYYLKNTTTTKYE